MNAIKSLESKLSELSPDSIIELDHYLDYLIHKNSENKEKKLKLTWAGRLKDESIGSVELQKKSLEWR